MRILGMADLHGHAERLSPLKGNLEGVDIDLIAFCGDLHNLGAVDQARPVAEALAKMGSRVLIVPGNMDPKEIVPGLWREAGLEMIHRKHYRHEDYGFIGIGGMAIRKPLHLKSARNTARYYHLDDDVYKSLTRLHEKISDSCHRIVLTHQPPRNARDMIYSGERTGSIGLRRFVEEQQPDLLICGHIHEDRGEANIGSTRVVNVGEMRRGYAAIIEVEDEIKVRWIGP